ncbi:MAG: ABC-2 transporter permease [Lachnospiraceae bacterium]|nr:ABC-2 transporter permease [Candidatus Equihabitans merdae]
MKALFEKDIRLVLIRKSALFIYLFIGVVFTWQFSASFSGAYVTMLGTILALSTLSYDDSDNCLQFLFTLPCTRRQYVAEKYLFVYGFSLVAGFLGLLIIAAAGIFKGTPLNGITILEVISSELPILVVTGGIMIPLQMKFGPERSRAILLALIGVILVIAFTASKIAGADNALHSLVVTLDAMNPISVAVGLVLIMVLISVISIMISMRIMTNREF